LYTSCRAACTIICAMYRHTHTHTLTLTGYNRGEPSPHIPRVCVRVEDASRRRRANARRRRRPAACAACRVYRTRVMCRRQGEARGWSGVYISRRRCRRRVRTGIDISTWSTLPVKSSYDDTGTIANKYTVGRPGRIV